MVPNLFGNRDEFQFVKDNFSTDCDVVGGKQFGDGSSALHLLCTLCLLLLHHYTSDHQALDPRGRGSLV